MKKTDTKKEHPAIMPTKFYGKLIFILCLFISIPALSQDSAAVVQTTNPEQTANILLEILAMFGVVISSPVKALILLIVPFIIRYIEKRNLTQTIKQQEAVLTHYGIEQPKHKNIFKRLIDKFRHANRTTNN